MNTNAQLSSGLHKDHLHLTRRRALSLIPAIVAASASAGEGTLTSQAYPFDSLPVHHSDENAFRPVLEGTCHAGTRLEVHESALAPGASPHPPHRHVHEEMFLVREGAVEVTIGGKTTRLGPGGAAFVASNDEHGIKNVGEATAQYFVVAIGNDK